MFARAQGEARGLLSERGLLLRHGARRRDGLNVRELLRDLPAQYVGADEREGREQQHLPRVARRRDRTPDEDERQERGDDPVGEAWALAEVRRQEPPDRDRPARWPCQPG